MSVKVFGSEPEGATPLTDEDYVGLKPNWIANRADLNQAEAQNISQAFDKYLIRPMLSEDILDELFVRKLHGEMFSDVWSWAGKYRQLDTSIGSDPLSIQEHVFGLMENAKYWIESNKSTDIDAAVCEIHHKLVLIHPFRNGNGRMTRMFADLLLGSKGQPVFSWGGGQLEEPSPTREKYIAALRAADKGDLSLLLGFVRA
jgi:Fic-DOC domain mobile mystery protein B